MEIFLNGNYYQSSEAPLKLFDRGFLFGDGLFTTMRVENGSPLFLSHHLNRLRSSCQFFGIEFADPGIQGIIDQLLKKNGLADARVKIIVSRGVDFKNLIYDYPGTSPTIAVLVYPLALSSPKPVGLCISEGLRGNESIYHHKTTSYLQNLHPKTLAQERGFHDCVILNWEKLVCETSTANLFLMLDNKIITPPDELPLLNGIMRQILLSLRYLGNYPVLEECLTGEDLKKIDGAFITSAVSEICPVERIENHVLSTEKSEVIRKEWYHIKSLWLKQGEDPVR